MRHGGGPGTVSGLRTWTANVDSPAKNVDSPDERGQSSKNVDERGQSSNERGQSKLDECEISGQSRIQDCCASMARSFGYDRDSWPCSIEYG